MRTMSTEVGPFGIGTNHNYSYRLDVNNPFGQAVVNFIVPDGNRFPFADNGSGTRVNGIAPQLRGVQMTVTPNNETDLRFKDGTVYHFVPSTFALGSVLESITDSNGNQVTIVRNPANANQITEVIDPRGRKLLLTYDGGNRITSIMDPIGAW